MAIVAISPPLASAKAARCVPAEGVLAGFRAATSAKPAPKTPFLALNPKTKIGGSKGESRAVGKKRRLADYKGKGVVLNFWATWCAPCVREMPALDNLRALLAEDGIEVLALSEDRRALDKVPPFFKTHEIKNLETLMDEKGRVSRAMGVQGLPTTILVGRDGKTVGRLVGVAEWDDEKVVSFLRECLGREQ